MIKPNPYSNTLTYTKQANRPNIPNRLNRPKRAVLAHNDKNNSDDERDDLKFAAKFNHDVLGTRIPIPDKLQSQKQQSQEQQLQEQQSQEQQSQEQYIKINESTNIGDTFTVYLFADGNLENIGKYQYRGIGRGNNFIFTCLNACNGGVGEGRNLELSLNELNNYYRFKKTSVSTSPNKNSTSRFRRIFGFGQKSKRKGKRTKGKRTKAKRFMSRKIFGKKKKRRV
jgi:hypothetical protein